MRESRCRPCSESYCTGGACWCECHDEMAPTPTNGITSVESPASGAREESEGMGGAVNAPGATSGSGRSCTETRRSVSGVRTARAGAARERDASYASDVTGGLFVRCVCGRIATREG